jgi:anti-sigma factor RsiW
MIITCRQLAEAISDARDQHLSALDRLGYRAHLLRCRHCRALVAQMEETIAALGALPSPAPAPAGLPARRRARRTARG